MEGLNDEGVENVFQHFVGKIIKVSFAFNAHVISQTVHCFNNPTYFRDWVIQMKLGILLAYRLRQTFACAC